MDSKPRTSKRASDASTRNESEIPLADLYYELKDGKRQIAVVFNHLKFDKLFDEIPPERKGAEVDGERIQKCLISLGFENFKCSEDLVLDDILKKIREVSAMKASDVSCIMVVVMTHGSTNGDLLARNCWYNISGLVDPIVESDTLVGVPKLFFIQACRGEKDDDGKEMYVDGDGDEEPMKRYKIPTHADCLIMYSTVKEHFSYRRNDGSIFIQSLCEHLENAAEPNYPWDLLHMLIFVNKKVAKFEINFSKSNDEKLKRNSSIQPNLKKQIPQIETTMTKFLKFESKIKK